MSQTEISNWLKTIVVVLAVTGALIFCLLVPLLASNLITAYRSHLPVIIPTLVCVYVVAFLCYSILFYFWKVSREIGHDNTFSLENSNAFSKISKICLGMIAPCMASLLLLGIPGILHPAILVFYLIVIIIAAVLAVLAAAMSHLIRKAYDLKQENDLTI